MILKYQVMVQKPSFAVASVSIVLVVYCTLIGFDISLPFVYFIFTISPFLMVWLVYTIIRFGVYNGKEFRDDEEWGYQDKDKEELNIF